MPASSNAGCSTIFWAWRNVAVAPSSTANRSVSGRSAALWIGNPAGLRPLRNVLGLSRIRVAYTAGAAIGPELFSFYRSIGINLKQLYGQTETCAYVCLQPDGQVKPSSVGAPAPGVEIKIADNGEVLVKGPCCSRAVTSGPTPPPNRLTPMVYFATGDAGFIDADGHLNIIDRAKDVGRVVTAPCSPRTTSKTNSSSFSTSREVVCFGHERDRVCAFVNIDVGAVGNWAERRGIAYSGYTDLTGKPPVHELIKTCVDEVNATLAHDAMVAESQIHRFLILHKELDPDDDELTRTRKVRRNFVAKKYQVLIDALYGGQSTHHRNRGQVRGWPARQGVRRSQIIDAETFPVAKQAA